ncbi:unnamed protein product [Protopolystoma xenopodis]|uniref:Uncharacterized protein n=1 Tax=Protopolystoma xenopodis TaxID=117903 RepID=A0A3S5B4K1_9PLAT|nr:unnamed protein product [Protopolystoma xenopodis]
MNASLFFWYTLEPFFSCSQSSCCINTLGPNFVTDFRCYWSSQPLYNPPLSSLECDPRTELNDLLGVAPVSSPAALNMFIETRCVHEIAKLTVEYPVYFINYMRGWLTKFRITSTTERF